MFLFSLLVILTDTKSFTVKIARQLYSNIRIQNVELIAILRFVRTINTLIGN